MKENEQEAFNWLGKNKLSYDIWDKKYRFNGESFQEWLDRVSNNDEEVKQLIKEKKFLFGGRILANRNIDLKGKTYSNCYVLPKIEDSIESIYDTCAKLARTYSYGGGCGVDISNLRPKGAIVNNAAKTTTGAVSFMDTFSQVTETIGQNSRRGALMISISCIHPDIQEFINIKNDLNKVTAANISVRVTDDFMMAVEQDKDFILKYPVDKTYKNIDLSNINYNELINVEMTDGSKGYIKKVKAKEVFKLL